MSTKPLPVPLPPGLLLNATEYQAQGRWVSADKVRFVDGMPEKIGGWEQWNEDGDELDQPARSMLCWSDFSYNLWHAIGTQGRLWVFNQAMTRTNITPYAATGTLANPFSTTNASPIVNVADTAHGVTVGQYVNFSGASAVGGITIDGEYQVTSVVDANNYRITHSSNATSTAGPGGGGSVAYSYELPDGYADVYEGGGWGLGPYGEGTYGTARTSITYIQYPRYWSLDKYGQYLYALPSGGTVYQWQVNTANRATALTNAPTGLYMFITSERIVVVLGAGGDNMKVQWSDDDDPTLWTPAEDNTANSRRLQDGSRLVAAARLVQQVNLIWSDTAAILMQWTGSNAVYSTRAVGKNCGLVGPGAFVVVDGVAYWMSQFDFHMYSGSVQSVPNSSDVSPIFKQMSVQQRFKTTCFYNVEFNEVWWLYPSTDATEPDSYVVCNLDDYSWVTGTIDRTVMATRDLNGVTTVLGVSSGGVIYQHESGTDDDTDALDWHIESGYFDFQNGGQSVNIDGYFCDFNRQTGAIDLTFTSLDYPEDTAVLDTVETTIAEGQSVVDVRHFGRQVKLKLSQTDVAGGDFRLGAHRLEVGPASPRR